MTDGRGERGGAMHDGRPKQLEGDLEALRRSSGRRLPDFEQTMLAARSRAAISWRERLMSNDARRTWLVPAATAAALVVAMLVVPISYDRTVGHEVKLELAAAQLDPAALAPIARELKSALGAESVTAAVENRTGSQTATLTATVPAKAGRTAAAVARAFATSLESRGYDAVASVTAKHERVSGSVYAFARDQVIRISMDGKSASQLESEIRSRLAEAGVPNADVSVTEEPGADGSKKVKIGIEHQQIGTEGEHTAPPQIELTKDGQPVAGEGFSVQVKKLKDGAGVASLAVEVKHNDRTATATVPNYETLGDAAVAASIESQLAAAGILARVRVTGGQIEIEPIP